MSPTRNPQLTADMKKRMKEIFYDPKHPAGLASAPKLAAAANVPLNLAQLWLRSQDTYTLHRQARKRYPTRKYYVNTIDEQWQMDLADMNQLQAQNRGYRYILTCVDVLSRYGWARPLKTKTGVEVAAAIKDIFENSEGRVPEKVQCDDGREFWNSHVRNLLKDYNVKLFTVKSPFKCALVERWNRTIKSKLWKLFTSRQNRKWLDDLPLVVDAYNHTYHRTIAMSPSEVTKENAMLVWEHLYGNRKRKKAKILKNIAVGDKVRISRVKGQFEKGYLPNWSREEFIVHKHDSKMGPSMVSLRDHRGEVIEGKFYGPEIQKIHNDDDVYDVEKVIRKKKKHGETWLLVKWLGYGDQFNSWIRESSDIVRQYNPS